MKLYLLPGLGTDARLFDEQRRLGLRVEVPAWIEPRSGEALSSYAGRMARTIDTTEAFALGGVSFGGMVALEMAMHVRPNKVLLIATTRSCRAVPRWMRALASVAWMLPANTCRSIAAATMGLALRHERLSDAHYQLLYQMCIDTPPAFFKWATAIAARWQFTGNIAAPVHAIHGSDDRLLRSAHVDADTWVEGGGHMINLTYAEQVTQWITRHISAL